MKAELLRPVDLKLTRAAVQLAVLADSMQRWAAGSQLAHKGELLDGRLGFRITIAEWEVTPPIEEWGLLVGELVHNLRTSLDNLAYALACVRQNPPARPWELAYPIFGDQADFDRRGRRGLNLLPDAAAQLIEHIQPFQREVWPLDVPEFHPLMMLQRLSNSDKHRLPKIAVVVPQEMKPRCTLEFHSDEEARAQDIEGGTTIWGGPIEPGVVLFELRTTAPIKKVDFQFEGKFAVSLEEEHRAPAPEVLGNILSHIHEVVGLFRHHFA